MNVFFSTNVFKLSGAVCFAAGIAYGINEANVFEWWDDGLVTSEEAKDMLNLLEEGNVEEACLLAETYSLENCSSSRPDRPPRKKKDERPNQTLFPHGHITWRGRSDSLGNIEHHQAALQMDFYRFQLRLGPLTQLTYRNGQSTASFGQISTRELHSHIPLDTLWGTSFAYSLGNFRLAATLDTALTTQVGVGYTKKQNAAHLFLWHTPQSFSAAIQTHSNWGTISGWWQLGQSMPLIKLELNNSENQNHTGTLSWKISAYIHGDSVPEQALLSKTILKNRFWSNQTISYVDRGDWHSKFSVNTKITSPLPDSSGLKSQTKARFKIQGETGPDIFRGTADITCLDATQNCSKDELKLTIATKFSDIFAIPDNISLKTSVKSTYSQKDLFTRPRLELGSSYTLNSKNTVSITLVMPKTAPMEDFHVRTQTAVGTESVQMSIAATFRRTRQSQLHLTHALLQCSTDF